MFLDKTTTSTTNKFRELSGKLEIILKKLLLKSLDFSDDTKFLKKSLFYDSAIQEQSSRSVL